MFSVIALIFLEATYYFCFIDYASGVFGPSQGDSTLHGQRFELLKSTQLSLAGRVKDLLNSLIEIHGILSPPSVRKHKPRPAVPARQGL